MKKRARGGADLGSAPLAAHSEFKAPQANRGE